MFNVFQNGQNIIKVIDFKEELLDFIKKLPELRISSFNETKDLHKTLQIEHDMEEFNCEDEEEKRSDNDQQCNEQQNTFCYYCIFCCFNILVHYTMCSITY